MLILVHVNACRVDMCIDGKQVKYAGWTALVLRASTGDL